MKKLLFFAVATLLAFSSLTASAANGSYTIHWSDHDGKPYTEAIINGVYDLDYSEGGVSSRYLIEVGTTVTIELPTRDMTISNPEIQMYEDGWIVYNFYGTDTGACTVTNLNKGSYNDGYDNVTYYKPGITVRFNRPGSYYIETFGADIPGENLRYPTSFYQGFTVVEKGSLPPLHDAQYTNSKVLVNGVATSFEAYNIGGSNYFKLRDLAMALNGTDKQFEVTWDAANNQITMITLTPYTPVGGELAAGDGTNKQGNIFSGAVYCQYGEAYGVPGGYMLQAKAYNINGNNYFNLRDVCRSIHVNVTWDAATSTIGIDTLSPYMG